MKNAMKAIVLIVAATALVGTAFTATDTSGVVVDGVGYGIATGKKPAMTWAVTVK